MNCQNVDVSGRQAYSSETHELVTFRPGTLASIVISRATNCTCITVNLGPMAGTYYTFEW